MNLRTFTKEINEGRGCSYSLRDGIMNPKEGYMVSLNGREVVARPQEDNTALIQKYVLQYGSELDVEGSYLGAWHSGGNIHLDVSVCVPTLSEAIKLGKVNCQIAVWDCANNVEIYL